MSIFNFKLPDIGEGVMEGEIVRWLVTPGDVVKEDQPVVEVMTDEATVTITSPKAGTIDSLGGAEGAVIPVHSTLVTLKLAGDQASAAKPKTDEGPAATAVGDIKESLPGMSAPPTTQQTPMVVSSFGPLSARAAATPPYFNDKPLAAPATRKLARDLGIDLRTVAPTGSHGRVSRDDVHAANTPSAPVQPQSAQPVAAPPEPVAISVPPASIAVPIAVPIAVQPEEERQPLRGMRKRIFDAMGRSKRTAAHFTFVEECDVSELKATRGRLKPLAEQEGVKLTFLPFFVKAVVLALKRHPALHIAYDEATKEIVQRRRFNIGIASATEAGLMVPVIKDADQLSLLDVAREIARLAEATKTGAINADDLRGSTFTITSLGRQGGLFATPILNLPEVGILGIHQIKQKPVVRDGQIVIGDVMLLSLSFDHRLIDGHIGAAFAYEIIGLLEQPDRLLLEG